MYSINFRTNNWRAALQAAGAIIGLATGWRSTGTATGGLIGGIIGIIIATLVSEALTTDSQVRTSKRSSI